METAQEGTFVSLGHTDVPGPARAKPAEAAPPSGHVPPSPASAETPHSSEHCRNISEILARVGDKWSVQVVMLLGGGPRRFNELKRAVAGISQRMLTLTLRGLERDGLVTRTLFPTIPPRVDYALTPLGHSLWEPVKALGGWAIANGTAIEAARQTFDRRNE